MPADSGKMLSEPPRSVASQHKRRQPVGGSTRRTCRLERGFWWWRQSLANESPRRFPCKHGKEQGNARFRRVRGTRHCPIAPRVQRLTVQFPVQENREFSPPEQRASMQQQASDWPPQGMIAARKHGAALLKLPVCLLTPDG